MLLSMSLSRILEAFLPILCFGATLIHFLHLHFVPVRVVEFSLSPEGMRFYKVQWQESWLPEHHLLLQYQNLIELFWRNRSNGLSAGSGESQLPNCKPVTPHNMTETESVLNCNTKKDHNDSVTINPSSNQSFLNALQTDDHVTSSGDPYIIDESLQKETFAKSEDDKSKYIYEEQQQPHTQQQQSISDSSINSSKKTHVVGDKSVLLDLYLKVTDSSTTDSQIINNEIEGTEEIDMRYKTNELTKVISQSVKKKTTTLQLEGFELTNIENTSVTEEELRNKAIEVLHSFTKKRVRCSNASSQLPHTCFFCTKILSSRKKLREHQFSIHLKNVGEFICNICQQRFAFRRKLKAHMITHSDHRNFVCNICGLTCKRRTHLHTHMQTHEQKRNYRCDVCHKNFKVQAELKMHCLDEHKNQISKCNICKHTLQTAFSVYIHSMRHSGTRDHICQVCAASFKSKHHLTAHQKTHDAQTKKIKCPECDLEFPDKKHFRKHLELSHKEIALNYRYDYICTICNKDFAYKGRLDEHIKIHAEETEEERNISAKNARRKKVESLSEEAFKELSNKVERIVNSETGEVKLKCKLCQRKEFRLISTMEKHLANHNSGLNISRHSFQCEICKKSFSSNARLLRHNVVHQSTQKSNNIYQCRNCKVIFKCKSCLQTHLKKCSNQMTKGAGKREANFRQKKN